MEGVDGALYWDTSAVLSVLLEDQHSPLAVAETRAKRLHLLSSLAWSETHAVISRMRRIGAISEILAAAAQDRLNRDPWQRISAVPSWTVSRVLASRWALRGADLWHLALAKTLQRDLPELRIVTFDDDLHEAAIGEGL